MRVISLLNIMAIAVGLGGCANDAVLQGPDQASEGMIDNPAAQAADPSGSDARTPTGRRSLSQALLDNSNERIMASIQPGGWTDFNFNISVDARKVFDTAMQGLIGVSFRPLAVATQVVEGINYCFLCEAIPDSPGATSYAAKVYIYQPPQGQHPHLTKVINDKP